MVWHTDLLDLRWLWCPRYSRLHSVDHKVNHYIYYHRSHWHVDF